jgi:hypothetical protein
MGNPEKKIRPNFTSGGGQKHAKGKTLWNKEGMRYFRNAEKIVLIQSLVLNTTKITKSH